jgi:anti-sigma factor RsiW
MKCRELAEFLMDYVGDELSQESRAQFEFHLSKCTNCAAYLIQYQVTIKAGKIACDEMSDEMMLIPDDLVKAVLAAKATKAKA